MFTRGTKALDVLAQIMLDERVPPSARVAAANALLDRGYGKPTGAIAQPVHALTRACSAMKSWLWLLQAEN